MRLRTFLVRRAIHTVITLVVILVILFIIFRLMPGDPSRFFIAPGQPPQVADEICVSFGLCKWVPDAGNGHQGQFTAGQFGPYNATITVNDSAGNSHDFGFVYTKARTIFSWGRDDPIKIFLNNSLNPRQGDLAPGSTLSIRADVLTLDPVPTVEMTVLGPSAFATTLAMTSPGGTVDQSRVYSADVTPPGEGFYFVQIRVTTSTADQAGVSLGFGVNAADYAPFRLVEDRFYGFLRSFPPNAAVISINVTSDAGPISSATATIVKPDGNREDVFMFHPQHVERRSMLEQFGTYMVGMLTGNFGTSFYTRTPVLDEIAIRIGPTLLLFGTALAISYVFGILLGAILAWRRGSKMELSAIVVSLFFYSMPVFWFGLVLLWVFAFKLGWFPLGGIGGFDPNTGTPYAGLQYAADLVWHLALPAGNLVILSLAGLVLLMRNSMLEVMGEDYIVTAKAKGLKERTVMYKHAARNALLPVVTVLALSIAGVISGGVLTETIFSWPGMGAFLVQSTLQQDYPSVQAAFFILAVLAVLANMVADVLYAYLDPRVRL